jgi:rhodanese-related sulfurtransferase
MPAAIDAPTLKSWLSDGREIALFDVREHGQYGAGHLFFSVPLPYSRFEIELPKRAPNAAVRVVLCDGGDGVAGRAAARAAALGYRNVFILADGTKHGARRDTRSMRASTCPARCSANSSSTSATRRGFRRKTSSPCALPKRISSSSTAVRSSNTAR